MVRFTALPLKRAENSSCDISISSINDALSTPERGRNAASEVYDANEFQGLTSERCVGLSVTAALDRITESANEA